MLKKYSLKNLKKIFPNSNFDFLKNNLLEKIIFISNGKYVGGIVRDSLLGIKTYDIDISSPFLPEILLEKLKEFFPVPTGIEYGTISIFFKKYKVEITSLRKDVENYGRRAKVIFNGNWKTDSNRRDFTFNAFFLGKEKNNNYYLTDYHNGILDLKNQKIQFIGCYKKRIQEDYLRILRYIRFFLRYGNIKILNYFFLKEFISNLKILSIERVINEILQILKCKKWYLGIKILNELKISSLFFKQDLFFIKKINLLNIDRIFICFHLIEKNIIKKLSINKDLKKFLILYENNFDINKLTSIFLFYKSVDIIYKYIYYYNLINKKNIKINKNFSNETFLKIKFNYKFQFLEGLERGKEEFQLRKKFLIENLSNF